MEKDAALVAAAALLLAALASCLSRSSVGLPPQHQHQQRPQRQRDGDAVIAGRNTWALLIYAAALINSLSRDGHAYSGQRLVSLARRLPYALPAWAAHGGWTHRFRNEEPMTPSNREGDPTRPRWTFIARPKNCQK